MGKHHAMMARGHILTLCLIFIAAVTYGQTTTGCRGDVTRVTPVADAFVSSAQPRRSNGGGPALWVEAGAGGASQEIFPAFDLTGLQVQSLVAANLRLHVWVASKGLHGLRGGHMEDLPLQVLRVWKTDWSEHGLTWSSKPSG